MTIDTSRIDEKGRVIIPRSLRKEMGWPSGTTLAFQREGAYIRIIPVEDPFVVLMREAEQDYEAGRTRNLRKFARENNISIDSSDGGSV